MTAFRSLVDKLRRGLWSGSATLAGDDPQLAYRDLVCGLRQVMFQTDVDGVFTFLSPNWKKLTGFAVRESIGVLLLDYVHPEDRSRCQEYLTSQTTSVPQEEGAIILRWLHKDGHSLWIELHSNSVAAEHELHSIVGTLSDITERIREEQLQRASQRSLESLISNLPGMIYRGRNDEDWTMEYVSAGSVELTGYTPEDIINNKTLSYARLIHSYDRQRIWNEVQTALGENRPFDLEYRLITREGKEVWVWERGKGIFSTNGELLGLEGYIADISRTKLVEWHTRNQLLYDVDTGLPSMALFMDRLQRAAKRCAGSTNSSFILVMLELDRFAGLQLKYGDAIANRVAAETSRRLLEILDPRDTLSRMAENRFGILLEQPHDLKITSTIVRQIQEQLLLPFMIDDVEIYATVSVGVALSSTGYANGENALRDAATALSRAKALGGARYEVFDLHLHAKAAAQTQFEIEIKKAMATREMAVYWQPVIALASGSLVGLEARLAWRHPRRGMLFAEQFVPGAENTQLILPLWEYMLVQACEQMSTWRSLPGFEDVGINIEIFGRTLFDADSILRLGERLLASKPESFSLALGVPEDVLTEKTEAIQQMLAWLQTRKIRLILDSFGAGACSLSTLRRTPIDMIRIHPSLIEQCGDGGPFIQAIVTLAHDLGITVIADRIKTDRELSIARRHRIDYAQGDLISPPVDALEVTSLLSRPQLMAAAETK
jgi:PAS domain S-box-containing protein/diguanylate cyclase (GGDEF)-like protein